MNDHKNCRQLLHQSQQQKFNKNKTEKNMLKKMNKKVSKTHETKKCCEK